MYIIFDYHYQRLQYDFFNPKTKMWRDKTYKIVKESMIYYYLAKFSHLIKYFSNDHFTINIILGLRLKSNYNFRMSKGNKNRQVYFGLN